MSTTFSPIPLAYYRSPAPSMDSERLRWGRRMMVYAAVALAMFLVAAGMPGCSDGSSTSSVPVWKMYPLSGIGVVLLASAGSGSNGGFSIPCAVIIGLTLLVYIGTILMLFGPLIAKSRVIRRGRVFHWVDLSLLSPSVLICLDWAMGKGNFFSAGFYLLAGAFVAQMVFLIVSGWRFKTGTNSATSRGKPLPDSL